VRDSAGIPQIGAQVQLLGPDLNIVKSVFTDANGQFLIPSIIPGHYSVKAIGASFLPAMREDLRIHTNIVVNLTLNTLYEVMQWLPAEPRQANAAKDDWAWTLRSAANRPLLRWLEDGPLVVLDDGSGVHPRLKARIIATGQDGTFGENGERYTAVIEDTPETSRELLARVDFAPDSNAGMESMLGFRQDLGFSGSVQSLAAVAIHPEIDGGGGEGLDEAAVRTWESIHFGDELQAEVGATQMLARFSQDSANTILAALPFAAVSHRVGDSMVRYRMATAVPANPNDDETQASAWLPNLAERNGRLVLERGMHQELGWERQTTQTGMTVLVFGDQIQNPVLEAADRLGADGTIPAGVLYDRLSSLVHMAGNNYAGAGLLASLERQLPGGTAVRVSYANGDALALPSSAHPASLTQAAAAARSRRTQTYSIALSGTLEGSGTHWRATYTWQPEDTVTRVAPYATAQSAPYLGLHLRQPLCRSHEGGQRVEALLDVQNLLAQGYQPYLAADGSLLVFAQDQRSLRGGLAFTF
jgi:hypothetical protein